MPLVDQIPTDLESLISLFETEDPQFTSDTMQKICETVSRSIIDGKYKIDANSSNERIYALHRKYFHEFVPISKVCAKLDNPSLVVTYTGKSNQRFDAKFCFQSENDIFVECTTAIDFDAEQLKLDYQKICDNYILDTPKPQTPDELQDYMDKVPVINMAGPVKIKTKHERKRLSKHTQKAISTEYLRLEKTHLICKSIYEKIKMHEIDGLKWSWLIIYFYKELPLDVFLRDMLHFIWFNCGLKDNKRIQRIFLVSNYESFLLDTEDLHKEPTSKEET